MIILNAFSLNMLAFVDGPTMPRFTLSGKEIYPEEVVEFLTDEDLGGIESAIGHADTAALFSAELGIQIPCERRTVSIVKGERVIVGQYKGERLPEGATKLPDGAEIKWFLVEYE
jgi:hypothetical protein